MPFKVVRNDIIKMKVDAIVNPTNRYLKGSDSIDGIIHRAGGEKLEEECRALNGCKVGEEKLQMHIIYYASILFILLVLYGEMVNIKRERNCLIVTRTL